MEIKPQIINNLGPSCSAHLPRFLSIHSVRYPASIRKGTPELDPPEVTSSTPHYQTPEGENLSFGQRGPFGPWPDGWAEADLLIRRHNGGGREEALAKRCTGSKEIP